MRQLGHVLRLAKTHVGNKGMRHAARSSHDPGSLVTIGLAIRRARREIEPRGEA